jgi:hypothetical protein
VHSRRGRVVGLELESGSTTGAGSGLTGESCLSATAGAGEGAVGWRRCWAGWAVLWCLAAAGKGASRPRLKRTRPERMRDAGGILLARLKAELG